MHAVLERSDLYSDRIEDLELLHQARISGEYPELRTEFTLANSAYKMNTFEEWIKLKHAKKEKVKESGWNQVSLWKMVTGKM